MWPLLEFAGRSHGLFSALWEPGVGSEVWGGVFFCLGLFALDLEHLQWQGRGHIWLDLPGVWKFGNGMKLCETDILPFSLQIVCERLV